MEFLGEINFFLKSIILPLITVFTEILILIGIILLLLSVETKSTIYVLTIFLFFFVLYFLIISKKLKKWKAKSAKILDLKNIVYITY